MDTNLKNYKPKLKLTDPKIVYWLPLFFVMAWGFGGLIAGHTSLFSLWAFLISLILSLLPIFYFCWSKADRSFKQETRISFLENLVRRICHDLSNPLTAAQMRSERLCLLHPNDTHQGALDRGLKMMSELVSDVRKLLEIKDDKLVLELEPVNMFELIENLRGSFQHELNIKDVELVNMMDENFEFKADKSILKNNILANLLSNGIKFCEPQGQVRVGLIKNDRELRIFVADNGIGMTPQKIHHAFSIKTNRSSQGTLGERGTGFGLPLVKELVSAQGGKVSIQSPAKPYFEKGTLIQISYPYNH